MRLFFYALFLSTAILSPASAAMDRVELPDMVFSPNVTLTLVNDQATETLAVIDLEALGTYRLVTRTPWRDEPAVFEGARLADVLERAGLSDQPAVRITAENDYAVTVTRDIWTTYDALVATRVDGTPHSRRARGPLQIVFDMQRVPETGQSSFEGNWVWMVAHIEAVN
ncbi:MAG: hypothetical protein AAGI50_03610 [Pseudomonadota bacterium]